MAAHSPFQSGLGSCLEQYLSLKQALGRSYTNERGVLVHLDRFLAAQGESVELDAESFTAWCTTIGHLTSGVRRAWMRIARNFCLYRRRREPTCFVPDPAGFPKPHSPRRPHLFTPDEIAHLLHASEELEPSPGSPLRREVYRLAIVLLYTAGLRRGELLRLSLGEYDPGEQTLHIRATKFHKSRLVPLSRDAAREMERYLQKRRTLPHPPETPLLCHGQREPQPYTGTGLGQGMRELFRRAELRDTDDRLPRLHDLRHGFAHQALLRWYHAGVDVQSKLPALATYMGHVSIFSTQHYLASLEPVAQQASERFHRHCLPFLGPAVGEPAP